MIELRRRGAWHTIFKIDLFCAYYTESFMQNLVSLAPILVKVCVFIQTYALTDGQGSFNSVRDTD